MLENSNLITGKTAKEIDELIKKYEDACTIIADLEKTKKEVSTRLFELTQTGINETMKVVFNIVENKGRESISIKKLEDEAPNMLEELRNKNLVTIGKSFKTIKGIKHKNNI